MRLSTRSLVGAMALTLAFGNFGRIPFIELGGRAGAISVMDLLLLPLWLLLVLKLPSGARRWRLDGVSLALLLFIGVAAASTALAGPRWGLGIGAWLSSAAFLVRWVLYAGVFVLVVSDPEGPAAAVRSWRFVERTLLFLAGFGLLQAALLPDLGIRMFEITGIPADPQGHRLVSTLFDPQHTGGLLAFGLLIFVARAAEGLPIAARPMLLLGAALLLTVSRSAILGFAAGLLVIVMVRGLTPALRRLALYGVALVLPVLPALFAFARGFNKLEVDGSAMQRLIPWLRSVTIIVDHPWLGAGFNAAAHAQRSYGWVAIGGSDVSMDGGLLFIAVMTGLVGLGAYCLMLGAVWRAARRTWRSPQMTAESRAFAVGTVAATAAVLVQSLFTSTLLVTWFMLPLWVAWARVVVTAPAGARAPRAARASLSAGAGGLGLGAGSARGAAAAGAALLVFSLGGCDPCAGVANCRGEERYALTGTIISRATNRPAAGLAVEAAGRVAVTNAAGRWLLELPSATDRVDVRVGGDSGYVAAGVAVQPVRVTGDATEVGVWFDTPYFGYIMGFSYRGELLSGASVRFEVDPALGGGTITATSVSGPYLRFAGDAPRAGPVPGRFIVSHPATGTRVFESSTLFADYALRVENIGQTFAIDGTFRYGGNVVDRGTFENSPGTVVTFTRTGGLELVQNPVVTVTRDFGFFTIDIQPLGRGRIIGDFTFAPPNGRTPYVYRNIELSTYDSAFVRNLGLFAHGERWDWVIEVRRAADSAAVAFTPFEFVRTDGLALESGNVLTGSSNWAGRLLLKSYVRDTGTVTGVLTMRPAGQAPVTVGTFSLRTFAADTQSFAGVRYIPLP